MKLVILDAATLGEDLDLSVFDRFGEVIAYPNSKPEEVATRLKDADIVLLNKAQLGESNLSNSTHLKLICVAATGFDNIDVNYCRQKGIAVCNVIGYSTKCVAQVTVSMALSLITRMNEYTELVKNGSYSEGETANCVSPAFHEICGKTWGIIGYGNIGKQVGCVARALGCNLLVNKRMPVEGVKCVSIEEICKNADIISVHTPLNDCTRNLLNKERIGMMKKSAIVINVARGACADESALADAIKEGRLGGLGVDVYSHEPFRKDHPFYEIRQYPNVCLTPHMAWGGYETRNRLIGEMAENISSFLNGQRKNRVD